MNAPARPNTPALALTLTVDELRELVRDVLLEERTPALAEEPLLLTCSKLCRKLGVSRASVFRWRGEGMPSIKAGDEHRYVVAEVLAWLREKSTAAPGSRPALPARGAR